MPSTELEKVILMMLNKKMPDESNVKPLCATRWQISHHSV